MFRNKCGIDGVKKRRGSRLTPFAQNPSLQQTKRLKTFKQGVVTMSTSEDEPLYFYAAVDPSAICHLQDMRIGSAFFSIFLFDLFPQLVTVCPANFLLICIFPFHLISNLVSKMFNLTICCYTDLLFHFKNKILPIGIFHVIVA